MRAPDHDNPLARSAQGLPPWSCWPTPGPV